MTLYVAEAELGTVQPSRDFQILYHGYTVTRIANFCPKIIYTKIFIASNGVQGFSVWDVWSVLISVDKPDKIFGLT